MDRDNSLSLTKNTPGFIVGFLTTHHQKKLGSGRLISYGALLLAVVLAAVLLPPPSQSQGDLAIGYAEIHADLGSQFPVASALFSFRNEDGVLVSEAAIEALLPLARGRILVDQQGSVNTGFALANPSPVDASVTLVLRDENGIEVGSRPIDLPAGHHLSQFVNELLPQATVGFLGSLTFETDEESPLGAVTIRLSSNRHGEPLFATLPVVAMAGADASTAGNQGQLFFPHIGAGGILSTQILLINTFPDRVRGSISLIGTEGQALEMNLDGVAGSEFSYDIAGNGVFRGTLRGSEDILQGYAIVTASEGDGLPSGTAVFQYRDATDQLVSEAGVAATPPTQNVRIFVDTHNTQTGLAVALPESAGIASARTHRQGSHDVTFELFDLQGNPLGLREVLPIRRTERRQN